MTDPFLAEIRIYGFNFPPKGWAYCNGQLMPISQNTALFSLLGTVYGGDGKSTFALPDIQGSGVIQPGEGAGLSQRSLGEQLGSSSVTLQQTEIPTHSHAPFSATDPADQAAPANDRALTRAQPGLPYQPDSQANLVQLSPQATQVQGQSLPHNNLPPILALNYCIALQGVFPQRP